MPHSSDATLTGAVPDPNSRIIFLNLGCLRLRLAGHRTLTHHHQQREGKGSDDTY